MSVRIGLVGQRAEMAVEVARVAAALGAEVVRIDPEAVGWVGAADDLAAGAALAAVLVDVDGAPPAVAATGSSPGVPRIVVHLSGEQEPARAAAAVVAAASFVELPGAAAWLVEHLAPGDPDPVLAVLGAVGGAGATTLAIACATAATIDGSDCLLVDADPRSAGLDLPLGIAEGSGGRWSGVPDTADALVAESVRAVLPCVAGISVVTGPLPDPPGRRVARVLDVGRTSYARTVVDCGRGPAAADLLGPADVAVLVTPGTLAGVTASARLVDALPTRRLVLAVRPTPWLPTGEVVDALGLERWIEVPRLRRVAELTDCGEILAGRTGRALRRLGAQAWQEAA